MTIREALAEGGALLAAAGIESPSLDASLLLAEVLHVSRSSLIAACGGGAATGGAATSGGVATGGAVISPAPLAEESLSAFRSFIRRRLDGECVAYIRGRKEFFGLEFLVNPSVLVPRPDTETLVEAALAELSKRGAATTGGEATGDSPTGQPLRLLDLCTGSGAVAIALKHEMPALETWAADVSAAALQTAAANAARLLPPDSITFRLGDLFAALPPQNESPQSKSPQSESQTPQSKSAPQNESPPQSKSAPQNKPPPSTPIFSLIVSNPPYVPTADIARLPPEVRAEPALALDGGGDGLDIIRAIVARAPDFLCPGGALLLEADPRQMPRLAALLEQAGFERVQTRRDLSGSERVIQGQKPLNIHPPA